jgi:hypothetical protein
MSVTASQLNSSSNSTKAFVTALVANGGLLIVEIGAFVVLKNRLGRIYSPRTYLPPPELVVSQMLFSLSFERLLVNALMSCRGVGGDGFQP